MSTGRPKASSRETIAEAACELFLEQGYDATSIADIASRAGVSRSSFFNYFGSKADVLWSGLDERIDALEVALAGAPAGEGADDVFLALAGVAEDLAPDSLALAMVNATQMGIADELDREAAQRRSRIARAVARRFRAQGAPALRADVVAAALAGAVLGAVAEWARQGAGRTSLGAVLEGALDMLAPLETGMRTPA